jgi:hypothetical protein
VQIVEGHQQRADRSLPYAAENAVQAGLRGDVGALAAVSVQRHAVTGELPGEKLIESLADQAERQHCRYLVPPSDTDRKVRFRHGDRMLKHGGLAQPGWPHDK